MPRTRTVEQAPSPAVADSSALEGVFEDMRVMLTAKRAEYQAAADRISEILATIAPKPRIGRPPKAKEV